MAALPHLLVEVEREVLTVLVDDPDCHDAGKSPENFASCPETSYKELKPCRDAGKLSKNFASCPEKEVDVAICNNKNEII